MRKSNTCPDLSPDSNYKVFCENKSEREKNIYIAELHVSFQCRIVFHAGA